MRVKTTPFSKSHWEIRVGVDAGKLKVSANIFRESDGVDQQQQPPSPVSELQSHEGSPPLIMLLITAAAQPTPLCTVIAPGSQFMAQAPHSMQASRSTMMARLSSTANTS
jgi:hypothetical protein